MLSISLSALLIALAGGRTGKPPVPPIAPETEGQGIKVAVHWSGVTATSGCFFFSGPNGLGRDDALGTTACVTPGASARVSFGSAVFSGSTAGLVRRSSHRYGGEWQAHERLDGALQSDGRFSGSYRYAECQVGKACPGSCAISATVRFEPIGRCGAEQPRS